VYAAAETGAAAGSGPAAVTMKNPHEVTMVLHAVQEGVQLTLAAGGVNIDLSGGRQLAGVSFSLRAQKGGEIL
jgi:hypothetical protein